MSRGKLLLQEKIPERQAAAKERNREDEKRKNGYSAKAYGMASMEHLEWEKEARLGFVHRCAGIVQYDGRLRGKGRIF